jgi:hypothetical protein
MPRTPAHSHCLASFRVRHYLSDGRTVSHAAAVGVGNEAPWARKYLRSGGVRVVTLLVPRTGIPQECPYPR